MTLKFNLVRAVVKTHVRAKCHQAISATVRLMSYREHKLFCLILQR